MSQKRIFAINSSYIFKDPTCGKVISKTLIPLAFEISIKNITKPALLKFRDLEGNLIITEEASFGKYKDLFCIRPPQEYFEKIISHIKENDYFFVVLDGKSDAVTVVFDFPKKESDPLSEIEQSNPALRLMNYDLPPNSISAIDSLQVASPLYRYLIGKDGELHSIEAQSFLSHPHILTHLFAHVSSIQSKDTIVFLEKIKIISDRLKDWLKPKIHKLERDHNQLWQEYYGNKISFVDGGVSRIISLPGIEPMGIRVGTYTVIPGEDDPEIRENWNMSPYVIGDVIGDKTIFDDEDAYTDKKRLQEAARYIVEPLTILRKVLLEKPSVIFLHGPLQNSFETYDEQRPFNIPGVNIDFLLELGIDQKLLESEFGYIPKSGSSRSYWNSCIPVYGHIAREIYNSDIPIMGIVERPVSSSLIREHLSCLVEEGIITDSTRRKIIKELQQLEINESLLFGCILEEGQFLEPIKVKKNVTRRAHPRWMEVIEKYPPVFSTMIKTSSNAFPFRVEINKKFEIKATSSLMNLLYHTSLLLPKYAFPVGIDIVDKYAKIPDWLSKGVSAQLAATVFKRCIDKGDINLLSQMRTLLARSPRDFFFRPKP